MAYTEQVTRHVNLTNQDVPQISLSQKMMFVLLIGDFFIITTVGLIVYFLYVENILGLDQLDMYSVVILIGGTAELVCIHRTRLHEPDTLRHPYRQLLNIIATWSGVVAIFLVIGFLMHVSDSYSRVWVTVWYGGSLSGLIVAHGLAGLILERWIAAGRLKRNVVVVGASQQSRQLVQLLQNDTMVGCRVLAVFTEDSSDGGFDDAIVNPPGFPTVRNIDDLPAFINQYAVNDIIIALPWTSEAQIAQLLCQLRLLPVDVRLLPHLSDLRQQKVTVSRLAGLTMLDVVHRPLKESDAIFKRIEDVALTLLALPLVLPVMGLIAIAIKLDSPGPVLFRQKRFGFKGMTFEVWKFRTMHVVMQDLSGAQQTKRRDVRVTRLGRFLRATSLDELPQLFNVLRGDMSIVGPRPHPIAMKAGDQLYHKAVSNYVARHRVRPGLTGWAQINGLRGAIDSIDIAKKRVEHDLYYIENWSILLDLKIVLRTPLALLTDRNAF
jgi:polysaccharide biosynthesis protein PslA